MPTTGAWPVVAGRGAAHFRLPLLALPLLEFGPERSTFDWSMILVGR
jgi:hypothetical protein